VPPPPVRTARPWWRVRLVLGAGTAGIGFGALAAPEATVRVVGLVFGLHLLVTGLLRAALGVGLDAEPGAYQFCFRVMALEIAALGLVCLRLPNASAGLLILFVTVGWLLNGLIGIAAGAAGGDSRSRWYAGVGGAVTLTAVVALVWPELSLTAFFFIGVVLLIATGIGEIAVASVDIHAAAYADPRSPMARPRNGAIYSVLEDARPPGTRR
jgi:uncharacterized membrane protein HdeD (DUF308 family)